jgi:pterin-4a-carbinolamine dehydratase
MSTKIRKALKQKKEAVDVNTTIPQDKKVNIGGLNLFGTLNLNGDKKAKQSKKKTINTQTAEPMKKVSINFNEAVKLFSTIAKVSEDKYHFTAIRTPDTKQVICYLTNTKKGVSHYTKKDGSWKVAETLKSQEQITKLFESVQKQIEQRKDWASALTPRYIYKEFSTTDKSAMMEHLKSLL